MARHARTYGCRYRDHAMLGEDEEDEMDDLERGSFSELAKAKGRGGGLTPEPPAGGGGIGGGGGKSGGGAGGGGVVGELGRRVSSLGKKKPPAASTAAACDAPVAKPVERDSGWEASFDGVAAGTGTAAAGHSEADAIAVAAVAAQDAVEQQEGDDEAGARGARATPAATSEGAATLGARP